MNPSPEALRCRACFLALADPGHRLVAEDFFLFHRVLGVNPRPWRDQPANGHP